jgi:hypothetical protein
VLGCVVGNDAEERDSLVTAVDVDVGRGNASIGEQPEPRLRGEPKVGSDVEHSATLLPEFVTAPDVESLVFVRGLYGRMHATNAAHARDDFDRATPRDSCDPFVRNSTLTFRDLAVETGIVDAATRYRHRFRGQDWVIDSGPAVTLQDTAATDAIELETSHDAGERWSPPARVTLASIGTGLQAAELVRDTR